MPVFVVRPLGQWPAEFTAWRSNPFKAPWSATKDRLDREVSALGGDRIVIELAVREQDCRLDGWLRGDARQPNHPGAIVSFESKHGPLKYWTDTFFPWQSNVRAITLGLEALRRVDRYGIARSGEQYRGWNALNASPQDRVLTFDEAMAFLAAQAGRVVPEPMSGSKLRAWVENTFKLASKRLHPDVGGDHETFVLLSQARALLLS